MTVRTILDATRPYWPVLAGLFGYPLAAALLNWVLWFDSAEKWDTFSKAHPRWAFAIKVFRLLNPHLRPVLVAWRNLAAARSTLPPAPPDPPAGRVAP
jgi:hypothetical protein